jgi:hypothetical protein
MIIARAIASLGSRAEARRIVGARPAFSSCNAHGGSCRSSHLSERQGYFPRAFGTASSRVSLGTDNASPNASALRISVPRSSVIQGAWGCPSFLVFSPGPLGHVSNNGLTAIVYDDTLDPDGLVGLASVSFQGVQLHREGARQLI